MNSSSNSTLFIVRAQDWLSARVRSRLFASFLLLYAPLVSIGLIIQEITHNKVFSRGVIISTLWLAIAPFLIQDGFRILSTSLNNNKHLFLSEAEWASFFNRSLSMFQSPRYLLFGIPWALGTSLIVLISRFGSSPMLIKVWAVIIYFILFLVSAIGFQGILTIVAIILRLSRTEVRFDPYHPDFFGGLEVISRLAVRGTLYFSTGSLVFPLVFEILAQGNQNSTLLKYSTEGLTAIFVAIVIYSFLWPILTIKKMVAEGREKALLASNKELDKLYGNMESKPDAFHEAAKLQVYYEVYHKRLLDIKNYPYDLRVLIELFVSVGLPILIAVLTKIPI